MKKYSRTNEILLSKKIGKQELEENECLFHFRNEQTMIWRRLVLSINILMSFDVYFRMVVLGVILIPVLKGELIRPQVIFPALPLIYQFVDAVVIRMILLQVSFLSEMFVAVERSEVYDIRMTTLIAYL